MSAVIQFFRISFSDIALGGAWHLVQLLSLYEAYLCGEPLKVSIFPLSENPNQMLEYVGNQYYGNGGGEKCIVS